MLQQGQAPLRRGQTPAFVQQELYGLLPAHSLTRPGMAGAAAATGQEPTRWSLTSSLETLTSGLTAATRQGWTRRDRVLLQKVAAEQLRPQRERSSPRPQEAGRPKWPMKRAGAPRPVPPRTPLARAVPTVAPLRGEPGRRDPPPGRRRGQPLLHGH